MQNLVSILSMPASPLKMFCYLKKHNLWIFIYIYLRFHEEMKRINVFQTSATKIVKSKPIIVPSPSFWKEASFLLNVFWMFVV